MEDKDTLIAALRRVASDEGTAADRALLQRAIESGQVGVVTDAYGRVSKSVTGQLVVERSERATAIGRDANGSLIIHGDHANVALSADFTVIRRALGEILPAALQALPQRLADGQLEAPSEPEDLVLPPCPYRGLFTFRQEHAGFFFGREEFTKHHLLPGVRKEPLLALVGPSGSGKSSAVFAALVPALAAEGDWLIADFRPDARPLHTLAGALLPLLEPEKSETDRLAEQEKLGEELRVGHVQLRDVVARILQKQGGHRALVLIADQFEELYTLCQNIDEQHIFLDIILDACAKRPAPAQPSLHFVLTLRADFYDRAISYGPLAKALTNATLPLGPMTPDELREAIEGPSRVLGIKLEDGLTDRILASVVQKPGNLPLLEFALTLVWWRQRRGQLTHAAYDAVGGVEKALAVYAEQMLADLTSSEVAEARRIFVQLVSPGQGTVDTRRRATRTEVGENRWGLVARFATERLLVTDRDQASGQPTVELAHEALIANWHTLHGWVDEDREFLNWRQLLRAAIQQWEQNGRDDGALLRGAPLAIAAEWLFKRGADLSPDERRFIECGQAMREEERAKAEAQRQRDILNAQRLAEEAQRRATLQQRGLFALGILLLAAIIGVFLAIGQTQRAEHAAGEALAARATAEAERNVAEAQTRVANSGRLAALARALLPGQPDLGLLLAVQAREISDSAEARSAILTGLQYSTGLVTYLRGSDPTVAHDMTALVMSPTGSQVAVGHTDGSVQILDATTGRSTGSRIQLAQAPVARLAYGLDDRRLVALLNTTSSGSNAAWLIDTDSGTAESVPEWPMFRQPVVGFQPSGMMWMATKQSTMPVALSLWDIGSRTRVTDPAPQFRRMIRGTEGPRGLDSEGIFATLGSDERSFAIWWPGGTSIDQYVWDDNDWIRLENNSGTYTWNGNEWIYLQASNMRSGYVDRTVSKIAFTSDLGRAAMASRTGAIEFRDMKFQRPIGPLRYGHNNIMSMSFNGTGGRLASLGGDGSIAIWDVDNDQSLVEPLPIEFGRIDSVRSIPDGPEIAAGRYLIDLKSQRIVMDMSDHSRHAVSADGKMLAAATYDGNLQFVDTVTGDLHGSAIETGIGSIDSLAISENSRVITALACFRTCVHKITLGEDWTYERAEEPIRLDVSDRADVAAISDRGRWIALGYCTKPTQRSSTSLIAEGTCNESMIRVWDAVQQSWRDHTLGGHAERLTAATFSTAGGLLATADASGVVRLWEVGGLRAVGDAMRPHSKAVHAVAISQDGQMLASAGNDGFVVLTDTRSLVQLGRFRIPEFDANGSAYLDFSSDRRRLIVSNYFINTRGTGVTSGTR
ncbi:MAG TPA: AAA family ATPase, partial [Chloroflexota bacterium]